MPAGMLDALKMLPMVGRLRDLMPKTVKDAPCQEVVRARTARSTSCPILKCWPEDGGRYITLPLVFTKDPETGMRNIGTYRMQVFDGRTTGMHWQRHKGGAQHYRVAERLGKRLPVAVALGPDPALAYSRDGADARRARRAAARGIPARASASSWSSASRSISRCRPARRSCSRATSSPASAAAKGRSAITPASTRTPTTTRCSTSPASRAASSPTYLTTVVGMPPMEDYYLGKASERIFLPLIRKTLPEIVDMHFPAEGIFHNLVIVSIDKRYPGPRAQDHERGSGASAS